MLKLLQNQALRTYHKEINTLGWDAAMKQYPAVEAHMTVSIRDKNFTMDMMQYYTHVADIDTNDLEDAFTVHNNPAGNPAFEALITRYDRQHSMSVGDVLVDEVGKVFLCAGCGFNQVGEI